MCVQAVQPEKDGPPKLQVWDYRMEAIKGKIQVHKKGENRDRTINPLKIIYEAP